jgi:hypothetical protein
MTRLGGVRRLQTLYLEGKLKPIDSDKGDFDKRANFNDTFKFKLDNGDKGYVVIDRAMRFKLYSRKSGRRIGRYKLRCKDQLYKYVKDADGQAVRDSDDRSLKEFFDRKEIGLTNTAYYRAVRRSGAKITIGIRYDPNEQILPSENKKYLSRIHRSDYKVSFIDLDLKVDDSDPFQKRFGNAIDVCADPDSACYGEWFFNNGGGFENDGFFC